MKLNPYKIHWLAIHFTDATKKHPYSKKSPANMFVHKNHLLMHFPSKESALKERENVSNLLKRNNLRGKIYCFTDKQFGMGVNVWNGEKEPDSKMPLTPVRIGGEARATFFPLTKRQLAEAVEI